MAEFEAKILNSRGRLTSESQKLRRGSNSLFLGKHQMNIGVISEAGALLLDFETRSVRMLSATGSYWNVTLRPEDQSPFITLRDGESIDITLVPNTYHGIKRHVHVTRTA